MQVQVAIFGQLRAFLAGSPHIPFTPHPLWFAYFFHNQTLLDVLTQLLGFGRCILSNLPDEILAGLGTDPK